LSDGTTLEDKRSEHTDRLGAFEGRPYERIRDLLESRFGLEFPERRRDILRLHLRDWAEARGVVSWDDYALLLEGPEGPSELRRIVDAVTVHQTEFFRHRQLFDALHQRVVPRLADDARRGGRPLRIWSAGCATGEEPYSLAMVALAASPPDVEIVATDIAPGVLALAEEGVYPASVVDGVPRLYRDRFLLEHGDHVEVGADLRRVVRFAQHNLVRQAAPISEADLIMCCNVTIYFSDDAFRQTVGSLVRALRPGGYLVLGHSESLWRLSHPLELVDLGGAFAYRAPDIAVSPSPRPLDAVRHPAPPRRPAPPPVPARPRERASGELLPVELAEVVADAQGLLDRDHLTDLEGLLVDALRRSPAEAQLHLLMGMLRQRQDRADDAVQSFGRAIYCDAGCSLAWFYRAAVLEAEGDKERAAVDYGTAARCFRRDPADRWDPFLESMGHDAMTRLCEERATGLSGAAS